MGPCQVVGVVRCGFNIIAVVIMQCMLIHTYIGSKCSSSYNIPIHCYSKSYFLFNVIHQLSSYNHRESRSNAIALQHLLVSKQKKSLTWVGEDYLLTQ